LNERVSILAYGANRCAENLAWKLGRFGIADPVVTVPCSIDNADVVAANVFYSGHFYADLLFDTNLVRGTRVEAALLLLGLKQMQALHRSEEVPDAAALERNDPFIGARLARFNDIYCPLLGGSVCAYGYVSWSTAWAPDGLPLALAEVRAEGRRLPALSGPLLLERLHGSAGERPAWLARCAQLWERVRKGRDGYMTDWYREVVDEVRREGLAGDDGTALTGILQAERRGTLLAPMDTWHPPLLEV
jgi:hypothetical protein